ncbi:hypothetical protein C8Q76DRAFT_799407 [Earliella scabrosa]|nr:hypothetical protein C8Q76DRAFT_799407 [Earliella scabrosa]
MSNSTSSSGCQADHSGLAVPTRPSDGHPNLRISPFPCLEGPICLHDDILIAIMENSDIFMLAQWRLTSKTNYTVVATILRDRYRTCISPFVANIDAFNTLLRACGAVISGSVALQFFLPDDAWTPGDLDIYVADRMFDTFITAVMQDALNFHPLPRTSRTRRRRSGTPGLNGIRDVLRFRTSTGRSIDIVRSATNSPITPIRTFWTTLLMNFITPDACACGFPTATLARTGAFRGNPAFEKDALAKAKYDLRGFNFVGGRQSRYIADPSTWDFDYFGDINAMILGFRLQPKDSLGACPVIRTKRGWRIKQPFPRISPATHMKNHPSAPFDIASVLMYDIA